MSVPKYKDITKTHLSGFILDLIWHESSQTAEFSLFMKFKSTARLLLIFCLKMRFDFHCSLLSIVWHLRQQVQEQSNLYHG